MTALNLPDAGEWFFWRLISKGSYMHLELRKFRKTVGNPRWSRLIRQGRFLDPNPAGLNLYSRQILTNFQHQNDAKATATALDGDYFLTEKGTV